MRARPPVDTCHVAYLILFVQGVGALLPWNVFITAASYFADRLKDTPVHDSFLNWFSLAFTLATLVVVALNAAVLRPYLPSPQRKVVVSLIGIAVVLVLTAALVKAPSVVGTRFFAISILSIVVASICSAYLQEGLFELTTLFPEIYTQALMTGQSAAGFLVSLSACVLTWLHHHPNSFVFLWPLADNSNVETTAFIYFVCACATMVVALATFFAFQRLPLTRHYLKGDDAFKHRRRSSSNSTLELDDSTDSLLDDDDESEPPRVAANPWKLLYRMRHHAITVFLTLFVTLALFPVVTSSIESTSMDQTLFVSLGFVLFNLGDLLGRAATAVYLLPHRRLLAAAAFFRLSFFVIFILCNVRGSPFVVFTQDGVAVAVLLACAWSNGYLVSVAMMQSPHLVDRHHRPLAGAIMFLCLCTGLTAGSLASFGLRAILCHCNPF
ncbi:Aste57867_21997 [Aphanomyces stellatus]|uniref:Aste57867_21997 protein n=1 Tax=Aphanomyces stellatus TaxID=120398 RepID=A0A485LJ26_9STRA|nr:hypothetical protein As57867_021928 [Aphanomyces stellatus]VFT98665.1 Aste57867_21997 [Aphanomyces stellatus]